MKGLMSKNLVLYFIIVFVFIGCGGGGGSSFSGSSSSSFNGSSFKGIITSAVVEVYDFSNNIKGALISSGTVTNSVLDLPDANYSGKVLLEIKKDDANTASYIDEDTGNSILFNDLVLKMIITNFDETIDYIATPLTTIATELVLDGTISDIETAYEIVSKLFGLSFKNLNGIKPNIEGLTSEQTYSSENEYALSLLSLVSLQNEIASLIGSEFTIKDLIDIIIQDLKDGIFDGKDNNSDLTVNDGNTTLNIGDIPTKLSKAGSRSLSEKNPNLLNNMKGYFQRAVTASRTIKPPSIEIRGNENIKINEKSILSADGSKSPFGYTLTYAWSLKSSPENASVDFSSDTSSNTFITVDTEGNYTISLEISDGQNRVSKDYSFTADLDGDGLSGAEDLDRDGDGILNTDDKFPDNPAEFLDSDNNDIGNYAQEDEDGDSVLDINDEYPFDNTKSQITIFNESEFNGNLNDANVLTGTLPFKVSGAINGNGSDDDYFKFTSTAGTIISAKVSKSFTEFDPIISMIDNNGNPISSILTINDSNSTILTFRVPIDGTFALVVTDKNNQSSIQNTYTLDIFEDSDIDGVSNEFERAIGSNENSSDTDGDGIKDYYEINTTSFDMDSDGIPNWLDIDSDNDTLKDNQETLTDYDNDGLLNPFDTDSDGNSVLDSIELGTNPDKPLDSDGDTFADYIDLDDDNDGILDINDDERIISANIDATTSITVKGIILSEEITNFAQSKGSIKIAGENFTSDAIVILVDSNGVYNLTPTSITGTEILVNVPDIEGIAQVRVYDNSTLTTSSNLTIVNPSDPVIFDISYPNSQSYALENDTVTINGINLSNITDVKVNGIGVSINSATYTTVNFTVNSTFNSGVINVSSLNANSNNLSIFIGRQVSGSVVLPQGSSYSFENLKVSFAGIESTINNDGTFNLIVNNNDASSITIYTPEDNDGNISMYLSSIVLSDKFNNIIIDTTSTAIDIMFSSLNGELIENNNLENFISIIKNYTNDLSSHLEENLVKNSHYLNEFSDEFINEVSKAKSNIYNELPKELKNRSYVIDNEYKSGFNIELDGNPINGKINLLNDNMVYADYKIVNMNTNKVIKDYANEIYAKGILSPQNADYYLYRESSTTYDLEYKNAIINIVTPKIGFDFSKPETKLFLSTVLSQIIMPSFNEVLQGALPKNDELAKFIGKNIVIPAITSGEAYVHFSSALTLIAKMSTKPSTVSAEYQNLFNELQGGMTEMGKAVGKSLKKVGIKKISEILYKVYAEKEVKRMLAKVGTKLGLKSIPVAGQIYAVVDAAGTGVDIGLTLYDFAFLEDNVEFNVLFPISIEDMYPTSIKNNGSKKIITIEGIGLDDYCSNKDFYWSSLEWKCVSWEYPVVKTTINWGTVEQRLFKRADGYYYFKLDPWFIDEVNNEDIIVKIEHVHYDTQYINELVKIEVDAPSTISIVDELEITNITPDIGSTGTTVSISGAGFSTNISENKVYFTTSNGYSLANIIDASESELKVQVPLGTIKGDVWVQVDNEVSNKLNFTVNTTQLTIQFGDNGGVTDDTFALELNGKLIKSMLSPVVNEYGSIELNSGQIYTVSLKGITAPDAIGTYYISFPSEIEVISGDSLSGSDLTAGVIKSWQVKLSTNRSLNRSINHSITFKSINKIEMQAERK